MCSVYQTFVRIVFSSEQYRSDRGEGSQNQTPYDNLPAAKPII